MCNSDDIYSKGMADWDESQNDATPTWDIFQFNQFKNYLKGNVLEVGAGNGRISRLTKAQVLLKSLTLTEPSPLFAGRLKKVFKEDGKVDIYDCEIGNLPTNMKDYFDVVYSVHVLEHIKDDKLFFGEMIGLVRPGGTLIISVPAVPFLFSDLDREIGHYRRYNQPMLRQLVGEKGFKIVALRYSDFLGVIGSFFVSKISRITYKKTGKNNGKIFFKMARIHSQVIVPIGSLLEKLIAPPIGLNLTMVVVKDKNI